MENDDRTTLFGYGIKTFFEDLPFGLFFVALEIAAAYGIYTAVCKIIRTI
jgi:hypothetical protein